MAAEAKSAAPAVVGLVDRLTATFDPFMLIAILFGLVAGVFWRLGDARKKGETWDEIRNDLLVSAMTGLANFTIAVIVSSWIPGGPLSALATAMIVGAKGTDAMSWFSDRFWGRDKTG